MAFVPLQFPKYPGIERQDLTQGQLGSFKFTPVDNEPTRPYSLAQDWLNSPTQSNLQQHSPEATRRAVEVLRQQQQARRSRGMPIPGMRQNPFDRPHVPTFSPPNHSFFDDHIKPNLGDSRLKYGPATLRTAVESQSPEAQGHSEGLMFNVRDQSVLPFTTTSVQLMTQSGIYTIFPTPRQ